jgi:hypothetical protein
MTNFSVPNAGAELGPELLALAPGRRQTTSREDRRTFRLRAARARREARVDVLPITVVSLNRVGEAAACGAGPTIVTTSLEAA